MQRSEPRTHAPLGRCGGTVCGSRSMAAAWRCADCDRCLARLDNIMGLLLDASEGKDVQRKAAKLVEQMGITRPESNDDDREREEAER